MPQPLAAATASRLATIRYVLTDIDDTLTTEGRLPARAYAALEALDAAGIAVIPVTGRPAGWCDAIARQWPVAAVVGENGALWYAMDRAARRMRRWQAQPEAERLRGHDRLMALAGEALLAVPGSALSADQPFRLFDVAIDFCEDAGPLGLDAAQRIAALFAAGGAQAKISSIHVNAWIGAWDKRAGIEALFAARFAPLETLEGQVAFIGDSGNDAPLFAAIGCSVGVANVAPFLAGMETPPAFITRAEGGAGFAEFADALLKARGTTLEENAA